MSPPRMRPGSELPDDRQWVLALHDGDPQYPRRRWLCGRFNTDGMDRERHRGDLGLTMPGVVECWNRVVLWCDLPDPEAWWRSELEVPGVVDDVARPVRARIDRIGDDGMRTPMELVPAGFVEDVRELVRAMRDRLLADGPVKPADDGLHDRADAFLGDEHRIAVRAAVRAVEAASAAYADVLGEGDAAAEDDARVRLREARATLAVLAEV